VGLEDIVHEMWANGRDSIESGIGKIKMKRA
jgi:hypothetical protein